jgi:8-oxo-dGTP diphosphatase
MADGVEKGDVKAYAVIILFDENHRILLQHRSEDAEYLPGFWGFFGGRVEIGETPEVAVRREAIEELGYRLRTPQLVARQEFKEPHRVGIKYAFIERYDPARPLTLGEGQGMDWLTLEEVGRIKMIGHDQEVIEMLRQYI